MQTVDISHVGATTILTMNRPEQRNAIDQVMREEFADAIVMVRDDPEVRAVGLAGARGHFSAGGRLHGGLVPGQLLLGIRPGRIGAKPWRHEFAIARRRIVACQGDGLFGARGQR